MLFNQLISDITNVSRKEIWELKHSLRHLYWLLAFILLPILLVNWDLSRSLVSISLMFLYLPTIFAFSTSGQIVLDTILGEKKAKTLEVLLSTGISPLAIIVGKIIPATIIGFLISQVGLFALNAFSLLDGLPDAASITWFLSIFPLAAAYLASCITVMTTILVPDEKIAPTIGILIMFIPLFLLGDIDRYISWSTSDLLIVSLAVILLSALLTWLASLIIKKIPLFTKI